ncbi:MAG: hypothetical protein HXS52_09345 [Theionarchaea archaeon]|nr:hypothetical protein [Theionarchaea archaeon]
MKKQKKDISVQDLRSLDFGMSVTKNAGNVVIKIVYKTEIMNKFALFASILLFLYLCYTLKVVGAIESIIGDMIAALLIYLKKDSKN